MNKTEELEKLNEEQKKQVKNITQVLADNLSFYITEFGRIEDLEEIAIKIIEKL